MFKSVREFFSRIASKKTERALAMQGRYIRSSFRIVERQDTIYIVVDGIAVYEAQKTETIESVLKKMERMREIALRYENINPPINNAL